MRTGWTIAALLVLGAVLGGLLAAERLTSMSDRLTRDFVEEVLPNDPKWDGPLSSLDRKEVRGTLGIRFATGQNTSPRIESVDQWLSDTLTRCNQTLDEGLP